nr:unnamed protein product [Spirometra erinaceieuropaei]
MGTQHSSPGSMVCPVADVEVTKENQLIYLRHRRQECVQVLVEFVSRLVKAGHQESADADDGGEFAFPERQAEAHQTVADAPRQTEQSSHNVVLDGKGDSRITSLCPAVTAVEEGVADINLLYLALFGEPGLAECSDVHLVAHQFLSH